MNPPGPAAEEDAEIIVPAGTPASPLPAPVVAEWWAPFRHLLSATAAVRALGAAFEILIRRILSPAAVGSWNLVELSAVYLATLTVGVTFSSERSIPMHRSRGQHAAALALHDLVLNWTLLEGLVVASIAYATIAALGARLTPATRTALLFVPPVFLIQKFLAAFFMLLRARKEFGTYSRVTAAFAVLDWSLLAWAYIGGLRGLLVGAVVVGLVKSVSLALPEGWRPRISLRHFPAALLRAHLPYGVSYAAFKAVWTLGERADAVVVASLLGADALAYYYLGVKLSMLALEVPVTLFYVAAPSLMEHYARDPGGAEFSAQFFRYLRLQLFRILPVVLPLGYFGSEVVVREILPAFMPGLTAIKILMSTVAFLAIRHLYYLVLTAHARLGRLTVLTALHLFVFAAVLAALRTRMDALAAVAAANFIASGTHLGLLLWITRKLIVRSLGGGLRFWLGDLAVASAWIGLLVAVDAMVWRVAGAPMPGAAQFVTRLALFAVLAAPLALAGQPLRGRRAQR